MKIAQVAPLFESVPPVQYGGTERVVSFLTEELVQQGHDVTLFASGDSQTSAKLEAVIPRALRGSPYYQDSLAFQLLQLDRVAQLAHRFDLIHYHVDFLHFPLSRLMRKPQVTTLHGRLDLPALPALYSEFSEMPVISISLDQRRPLNGLARWEGNVYHGLPASFGARAAGAGEYLAFLGRISPEKRVDRAIEIAARAGMKLKVAAKVDPADRVYFDTVIRPLITQPHVEFIGEIGDSQKEAFLQGARALLFPIDWPEPFGLVMIEAMACGVPVIAFSNGSVPEILENGKTGFVVASVDEAVAAVARLGELDRRRIRVEFENRFSVSRMARDYVKIYEGLVQHGTRSKGRMAHLAS
jgi:glycosyltransferase involved in cell wall biosynthesis